MSQSNLPVKTNHNNVDTSSVGGVPYATFISSKSDRFAELAAAIPGLRDGDAVLIRPAPYKSLKLSPFRFHLLAAEQFWVQSENDGRDVVSVAAEEADDHLETVEAALLVYTDAGIIPARMSFRTTKCPAVKVASLELKRADTEQWEKDNPEAAKAFPRELAYLRFVANVTTQQKTARGSGRKYVLATSKVHPVTANEINLLNAHLADPEFEKAAAAVYASFKNRIDMLAEHLV